MVGWWGSVAVLVCTHGCEFRVLSTGRSDWEEELRGRRKTRYAATEDGIDLVERIGWRRWHRSCKNSGEVQGNGLYSVEEHSFSNQQYPVRFTNKIYELRVAILMLFVSQNFTSELPQCTHNYAAAASTDTSYIRLSSILWTG